MKYSLLKIRDGLTKIKVLIYLISEEGPQKQKKHIEKIKKIIDELEMEIRKME